MKKIFLFAPLMALFVLGCGGNRPQKAEEKVRPTSFPMITVPVALANPEQKAEYVAMHYWDNFDFTDTVLISMPEVTEQGFTDYVNIIPYFSPEIQHKSVGKMMNAASAEPAMLKHFIELFDKYLHDPNSPMRNEEAYIPVLEWIMASDKVDSLDKLRPAYQLEMAMKNRQGTKAADFKYTTSKGSTGMLYGINSPYTLVYFNNPGCNACARVRAQMVGSPVLTEAIKNGRVKVLALYPDKDLAEWRKEFPNIPPTWINAYDQDLVVDHKLYDLIAIPMLYLLDKDKTVILKDAPFELIEAFLANQS